MFDAKNFKIISNLNVNINTENIMFRGDYCGHHLHFHDEMIFLLFCCDFVVAIDFLPLNLGFSREITDI